MAKRMNEMPRNGRRVQVDLGNGSWFVGIFRHGDFNDMWIEAPEGYAELSGWYPARDISLLDD